ncbi:MAG: hypothetical protein U0522_01060 [Candidatus Paceibacterota bacterium]
MENVSFFLQKFKALLSSQGAKKQIAIEVIKEIFNIDIDPGKIKIKNDIVFIDVSPVFKNTLFLKKKDLLKTINERIGSKIFDIR